MIFHKTKIVSLFFCSQIANSEQKLDISNQFSAGASAVTETWQNTPYRI